LSHCIYSLAEFQCADAEHVLQNFLGARWTSREIVSNEVQKVFGLNIDKALEESLRPIRNLFGTEGGRGGVGLPLRDITSAKGEVFDFEPGFIPRLQHPFIQAVDLPDGRKHVQIKVGSDKQVSWALHLLRQEFPGILVDEPTLRSFSRNVKDFIQGQIQVELKVGGDEYFRGLLKSCFNLLAVSAPDVVFDKTFDALREFVLSGIGTSSLFVRWPAPSLKLSSPSLGPVDHAILIVSRDGAVEGIVKLFGGILHPILLADSYNGAPIKCGYIVDPLRKAVPSEMRQPDFDPDSVPTFASQLPRSDSQAQAAFSRCLSRIVETYYRLSEEPITSPPAA
jgi:hypothetical protein